MLSTSGGVCLWGSGFPGDSCPCAGPSGPLSIPGDSVYYSTAHGISPTPVLVVLGELEGTNMWGLRATMCRTSLGSLAVPELKPEPAQLPELFLFLCLLAEGLHVRLAASRLHPVEGA